MEKRINPGNFEFVGISVNLVLLQKIKHIDKERSGKWTLK